MMSALVVALLVIGAALFSEVIRWHDRATDAQAEAWELAEQVEHHKAQAVHLADDLAAAYGRIGELADELALAPAPVAHGEFPVHIDADMKQAVALVAAMDKLAPVIPLQRDGGEAS